MEDGGWRMEDGGWRMEDGGWRMEDGGWRMEDGGWRMEDGGWRMTDACASLSSTLYPLVYRRLSPSGTRLNRLASSRSRMTVPSVRSFGLLRTSRFWS